MGNESLCCNPSTQNAQIQQIYLPRQQQIETTHKIQQPFVQPSDEIKQTLQTAKQYRKKKLNEQNESIVWKVNVKYNQNQSSIFCRGGIPGKQLSGEVILYFSNRHVFQGQFKNNKPIQGIYVFGPDCYYVGQIQNYSAQGQGTFFNKQNNYLYMGNWSKNLPHGKGKQSNDQGVYEGQFMYGQKFGKGIYQFKNKAKYQGSFYLNSFDGNGKMYFPNGDYYEGQWKMGKYHGKGKFVWKNRQSYEGDYVNGRRQGHGKFIFTNGSIYVGGWKQGVQQGDGTLQQGYDKIQGKWTHGDLIL